jgi:alkane 1-monooxygenase
MSNALLYHVQRHSDHHAHAGRRYQTLRSFGDSTPQLPGGYVSMGACALIPPLWRRVIDKRLLAYYDGDVTRLNRGHVDDEAGPAQDAA